MAFTMGVFLDFQRDFLVGLDDYGGARNVNDGGGSGVTKLHGRAFTSKTRIFLLCFYIQN